MEAMPIALETLVSATSRWLIWIMVLADSLYLQPFPQVGQVMGKEVPYGTLDGKLDFHEPVSEAVLPLGLHPHLPNLTSLHSVGMGKDL